MVILNENRLPRRANIVGCPQLDVSLPQNVDEIPRTVEKRGATSINLRLKSSSLRLPNFDFIASYGPRSSCSLNWRREFRSLVPILGHLARNADNAGQNRWPLFLMKTSLTAPVVLEL